MLSRLAMAFRNCGSIMGLATEYILSDKVRLWLSCWLAVTRVRKQRTSGQPNVSRKTYRKQL